MFMAEGVADTEMFILVDGIVKVTELSPDADMFVDAQARGIPPGTFGPQSGSCAAATFRHGDSGGVEAIQIAKRDTGTFFPAHADNKFLLAHGSSLLISEQPPRGNTRRQG